MSLLKNMKLLVKDVKIKTLQTGDKEGEIVLRTLYAKDIKQLAHLIDQLEVEVDFNVSEAKEKEKE